MVKEPLDIGAWNAAGEREGAIVVNLGDADDVYTPSIRGYAPSDQKRLRDSDCA